MAVYERPQETETERKIKEIASKGRGKLGEAYNYLFPDPESNPEAYEGPMGMYRKLGRQVVPDPGSNLDMIMMLAPLGLTRGESFKKVMKPFILGSPPVKFPGYFKSLIVDLSKILLHTPEGELGRLKNISHSLERTSTYYPKATFESGPSIVLGSYIGKKEQNKATGLLHELSHNLQEMEAPKIFELPPFDVMSEVETSAEWLARQRAKNLGMNYPLVHRNPVYDDIEVNRFLDEYLDKGYQPVDVMRKFLDSLVGGK